MPGIKKVLFEERLRKSLPSEKFGIGEDVIVTTDMGRIVYSGKVANKNFGLMVLGVDGYKHFSEGMYQFMPDIDESDLDLAPTTPVADNTVPALESDIRAESKIAELTPDGVERAPDKNKADKAKDEAKKKKEKELSVKVKAKAKAPLKKGVEIGDLPDEIRDALVTTKELPDDQKEKVLADVADSLMKGLRSSGVFETEVHGVVDEILKAAKKILDKYGNTETEPKS